jgi:hypothetical protein
MRRIEPSALDFQKRHTLWHRSHWLRASPAAVALPVAGAV